MAVNRMPPAEARSYAIVSPTCLRIDRLWSAALERQRAGDVEGFMSALALVREAEWRARVALRWALVEAVERADLD